MIDNSSTCPCLSGLSYQTCCQPFHQKTAKPELAEQLMRSRYCAFYLRDSQYLLDTLYPAKRQPNEKALLDKSINDTEWLGLKIVDTDAGKSKDSEGKVEFVAFYQGDGIEQLHERSNFKKENDRWFYVDGIHLPPIKIGRNDGCFCGSGKKFKKCHG